MGGKFFQSLRTVQTVAIKYAVDLLHPVQLFRGKPIALKPYFIDCADLRRRAVGDEKGRQIVHELRRGRKHRIGPEPAELMHTTVAADDDVILHGHMAGEHGAVAHDDVVAEHAIVRDMTRRKEHIVRADARELTVIRRAMDRYVFTEDIAVADLQAGISTRIFEVLRLPAVLLLLYF
jgi:hypothetical protein